MLETKKGDEISNISPFVPLKPPFSNSFHQNLADIYSLKRLLYNEGITDYKGISLLNTKDGDNLPLPKGH